MRDVRPWYSLGIPLGSMLLFLAVAIASPAAYRAYVRKHETGIQEHGTIACLVPAVVLGVLAFRRRRELPSRWLGAWCALLAVGALYFAGEECSWGQNYLHWATPAQWSTINDQHETNLHNTSTLLDHAPRALLSLGAGVCAIVPIMLKWRRARWDPATNPWAWFWPTMAVVPAAALATLVGVPQKLHGVYEKSAAASQTWYGELFLDG